MKWVIFIFIALTWLYRLGKKEMAKQEAAKRNVRAPPDTKRRDAQARVEAALAADAARSAAMDAKVLALQAKLQAALGKVDPYALENTSRENAAAYDDEPEYDDTPPPPPVVFQIPQERVVVRAPKPPDVYAIPLENVVERDIAPPTVFAAADDTTNVVVNAQVRRDIERTRAKPATLQPARALTTTDKRALVRDSIILQTLLERHPTNPMFRKRR